MTIGNEPLLDLFLDLSLVAANVSAFVAENRENGTWNTIFRKRFNDKEIDRATKFYNHLSTFKQLTDSEDGITTVKECLLCLLGSKSGIQKPLSG